MRFRTDVIILIGLVIFVLGCKTKTQSSKKDIGKPSVIINPFTKQSNEKEIQYPYHPSQTLKNDLIHTALEVSFDWQKQYLYGLATLKFKPYFYPQDSLILDAKGMEISEVKLVEKGKDLKDLKFGYDQKQLKIKLDKTYSRQDSFQVKIKYVAKPNELPKGGSEAITSDIGLYFINPLKSDPDKPQQIWTQGETEASSCWFPTIDTPNEKTTQEMFITVDTGFVVLSNGKFLGSKNNGNGTTTHHWRQDLPHSPYLFMMAIGKYSIVKDKWKDLEVNYYVEPAYEKYAKSIFGNTPEMIDFFSTKLGYKYPWAKYSQVVVRDYVSGAMENTTATIFMEALQQDDRATADNHWDYIIAHELFHHWFGDLVTCESWANLPLNESFANYSEYLWFEYKYGINEADHHSEKEASEYFEEAKRKHVPLIRYHYKDREDMFDRHSYNKGGRILHMLRKYVGDEAFFESLKLYLTKNQYKPAEVHNLRLAFEEVTGEDLNWFFNQWFLASGYPELEITQSYTTGVLTLNVKQAQDTLKAPIYKLPLNVDVWVNGIKNTYPIVINETNQNFEFKIPGAPNLVVVDSDFQLLGKINHSKSIEENIFQYKNYPDRYLGRDLALKELFQPTLPKDTHSNNLVIKSPFDSPEIQEILMATLNDTFWSIRELALDQFSYYTIPDLPNFLKKIETIALSDPKPSVRAKAIYLLSSVSSKEYVPIFIKAMNEKPYSVAGAGFASYLKSGDKSVTINYAEWEGSNNINIVIPLANYYSASGTIGKYEWFLGKLKKGSPRVIYNLMEIFKDYVMNVDPGKVEPAKKVIEDISKNNKYEQIRSVAKVILEDLNEKTK